MSSDNYTMQRLAWLDQVLFDPTVYKTIATTVAYAISKKFNRQLFVENGVLTAWPSYATLAQDIGCPEISVRRAVKLLRDHGHIETTYRGGGHFSLQYCAVLKPARVITDDHPRDTKAHSRVVTGDHPTITDDHPRVVTDDHQTLRNKSLNEIFEEGARANDETADRPSVRGDGQIGLGKKGSGRRAIARRSKPGASGKPVRSLSHRDAARAAADKRLDDAVKALGEQAMGQVLEWITGANYESVLAAEMVRHGGGLDYIRKAMGEEKLASFALPPGASGQ